MYWTDGAYSVIVNGNPQFQDANPAQGIPVGTFWSAAWANNVTNELINLVVGSGQTPSATDQTQVFKAVKALVAAGIFIGGANEYDVSTTLTDADANKVIFFTSSTAATYTLPASNSAGAYGLPIVISNQGSAPLTIAPATGDGIDLASDVLQPGQVCALINDGSTEWHHLWAENGTSGQFLVGDATAGTQGALPISQADSRYATVGGTNGGTFFVNLNGTAAEGDIGAAALGVHEAYLYNNASSWGLFSADGGSLISFTRSGSVAAVGGANPIQISPAAAADHAPQWGQIFGGANAGANNVVGSRAVNTTYTNSTGRPIFLAITGQVSATASLQIQLNGSPMFNSTAVTGGTGQQIFVCAVVPAGYTYEVNWLLQSGTIEYWVEL
jgi:hypothetical protein